MPNLSGQNKTRRRLRFQLGKAFPPESDVSRFLARICQIRNDLVLVQELAGLEYGRGEGHRPGVPIYLLLMGASHYREAAKILEEESESSGVRAFLDSLDPTTSARFENLEKSYSPWSGSFVEQRLKPLRDSTFHYPDAQAVRAALHQARGIDTGIDHGEGSYLETRYTFADDLLVNIVEGHMGVDQSEVEQTMEEVATLIQEFIYFVHGAVAAYLDRLNESLFTVEQY